MFFSKYKQQREAAMQRKEVKRKQREMQISLLTAAINQNVEAVETCHKQICQNCQKMEPLEQDYFIFSLVGDTFGMPKQISLNAQKYLALHYDNQIIIQQQETLIEHNGKLIKMRKRFHEYE